MFRNSFILSVLLIAAINIGFPEEMTILGLHEDVKLRRLSESARFVVKAGYNPLTVEHSDDSRIFFLAVVQINLI